MFFQSSFLIRFHEKLGSGSHSIGSVRLLSPGFAGACEIPEGPLSFIDLDDVRYQFRFDTHTAAVILFQGDACDIQESIEHQGETFEVAEIRASRLPPAIEVLMIPASIKSIPARSCCDAANLRGFSFSPGSFLQIFCGFEGSSLKRLEVPPTTESVSEDAFAGSVLSKSLRFGYGPRIPEIDGFRDCGFISVTIPASVSVIKSNRFAECRFLEAVSVELLAQVTDVDGFEHTTLRHLALPHSVSVIGSSGFNACQFLKSRTIPEGSSLDHVAGFRSTRLQRIVACGTIHNHSVLDWMINPTRQTFLEYMEKELSAMRRSLAMIRRTVIGRLLRHFREPLCFDVPLDSDSRVSENSSQTLIPAPITRDFTQLTRVEQGTPTF
jgi:hypothetical protein